MAWVHGKGFLTETTDNTTSTTTIFPNGIDVREIVMSNTGASAVAVQLTSDSIEIWDAQVAAQGQATIPVFAKMDDITIAGGGADVRITVFLR